MKSPMTRVAAAAVVVLACVLASTLWTDTGSLALADVVAKVEQMQAYLYREHGTTQHRDRGDSTTEATVIMSNQYGMKSEHTGVDGEGQETHALTYVLPLQKSVVVVDWSRKQFSRMGLDDATLMNMKVQNRDPREMLKRLLACEYRELGTAVIDGITAQGFETTDPNYLGDVDQNLSATVWVAVDTWLPVRYELELDLRDGVHLSTVQDGYEWGIPVDARDFEPDIPADFTANELDGMQLPSYSEQGMIEALELAKDYAGRYPTGIDIEALQQLMKDIVLGDTPAAQQLREQLKAAGSPQAAAAASQKHLMKVMVISTFPRMLGAQGAEPVYHGDVVTPDDAALPLMRWKTGDDAYRVIFGDLHIETVNGETLAELEAALPR